MSKVTVTERIEAESDPVFIIKVTDPHSHVRYYVTKAVWEYDASKATNAKQEFGCSEIARIFEGGGPPGYPTMSMPWPSPPSGSHTFTHTDASALFEPADD
jgi:hypothetical protein